MCGGGGGGVRGHGGRGEAGLRCRYLVALLAL